MHLTFDKVRRDQHAEIIDHRVTVKGQPAGFGVDLDLGQVDAVREGPAIERDLFGPVQQVSPALAARKGRRFGQGQAQIGAGGAKAVVGKADPLHPPFVGQKALERGDHGGHGCPRCRALHRDRP